MSSLITSGPLDRLIWPTWTTPDAMMPGWVQFSGSHDFCGADAGFPYFPELAGLHGVRLVCPRWNVVDAGEAFKVGVLGP